SGTFDVGTTTPAVGAGQGAGTTGVINNEGPWTVTFVWKPAGNQITFAQEHMVAGVIKKMHAADVPNTPGRICREGNRELKNSVQGRARDELPGGREGKRFGSW